MTPESGYTNFNQTNFDPTTMAGQTSDIILFVVALDVSPSIEDFEDQLNTCSKEVFMQELKKSHRNRDIMIKAITFNDEVKHLSGFMPIMNLPDDYLKVKASGQGTALYQAVHESLKHAAEYRTDLEAQGVNVRVCVFIMTDGQDNGDRTPPYYRDKVKEQVQELRQNEAWVSTFRINMLGVGQESHFKNACIAMGLDPSKMLSTIGMSAKEIREQMGVVSASVSGSSQAAAVATF